eukprot:g6561.t1
MGKLKDLTPDDMTSIVGSLAQKAQDGTAIARSAASDMMGKLKNAPAWGAVSNWTADKFTEIGSLATGLAASDLRNIAKDQFAGALASFGNVTSWAKDQTRTLATKFKEAMPNITAVTASTLNEARGFLSGFDAADLGKLGKDAFAGAMSSLGNVTSWARDQTRALATKFKENIPNITAAAASTLNEAKGFLSGFDAADLGAIAKDAFAGAKDSFKEVAGKLGSFSREQAAAIGGRVKEAYGNARNMTKDVVKDLGALVGTLDAADLADLDDDALTELSDKAVKMMGGAKAASAFSADKIKKLSASARKAFNGADMAALASAGTEQVKAALGCDDGSSGSGLNANPCPGAIADITIAHDSAAKTGADLLAEVQAELSGTVTSSMITLVQDAAETTASTTTRRRRRRQLEGFEGFEGRRLTTTSTSTDSETVIRIEADSNEKASEAGDKGAAKTGGSKTVVAVTATDSLETQTAGASGVVPAAGALVAMAAAVAAAACSF